MPSAAVISPVCAIGILYPQTKGRMEWKKTKMSPMPGNPVGYFYGNRMQYIQLVVSLATQHAI